MTGFLIAQVRHLNSILLRILNIVKVIATAHKLPVLVSKGMSKVRPD